MIELYVNGILFFCANLFEARGVLNAHHALGKGDVRAIMTTVQKDGSWQTFAGTVVDVMYDIDAEVGSGRTAQSEGA